MTRVQTTLRATSLVVAIAFVTTGCGCAAAPQDSSADIGTQFALSDYGGTSLPVWVSGLVINPPTPGGTSIRCDFTLTGSTLTLQARGTFSQRDSLVETCDDGRPNAYSEGLFAGSYSVASGAVDLNYLLPDSFGTRSASGSITDVDIVVSRRARFGSNVAQRDDTVVRYSKR